MITIINDDDNNYKNDNKKSNDDLDNDTINRIDIIQNNEARYIKETKL